MSHDTQLDGFKTHQGTWDHTGSTNAGSWQASQGQTLSTQQPGESWVSYQTRTAAYDWTKGQNGR